MTIDRTSPVASLLSALRAESATRTERSRGRPAATSARSRDPSALQRDLKAIATAVSPDDAGAVDAARVRMVRVILQWEFGTGVREHADWHRVVEAVDRALQAGEAASHFETLLRQLRGAP